RCRAMLREGQPVEYAGTPGQPPAETPMLLPPPAPVAQASQPSEPATALSSSINPLNLHLPPRTGDAFQDIENLLGSMNDPETRYLVQAIRSDLAMRDS